MAFLFWSCSCFHAVVLCILVVLCTLYTVQYSIQCYWVIQKLSQICTVICVSVLGRLRDLPYIFAVNSWLPSIYILYIFSSVYCYLSSIYHYCIYFEYTSEEMLYCVLCIAGLVQSIQYYAIYLSTHQCNAIYLVSIITAYISNILLRKCCTVFFVFLVQCRVFSTMPSIYLLSSILRSLQYLSLLHIFLIFC